MKTKILIPFLGGLCAAGFVFGQPDAEKVFPPQLFTELLAINGDIDTKTKPKYLTPSEIVVSPDKKKLYVAEEKAKQVAQVDIATKAVEKNILLPNEPTGIAVSKDGATLYVTIASNRWTQGYVCVVDAAAGRITTRIKVGHFPRAPVLSPNGTTLYTCNWFSNDVSVVDLAARKEVARIPVTREPYVAAITPDGATLVVTNSLPDQKATDTVTLACKVALINTADRTVRAEVRLPVGSHSLFGLCITSDGKFALATHLVARFTIAATKLDQGWIHSNNLAIVDIAKGTLTNDVELDLATRGYSNPWALAYTDDNKSLCVTHMGTDEMSIIKLPDLLTMAQAGKDLSHDFSAIHPIRTSLNLTAKNPRALAIAGNNAYIAGYFSDSLDVVALSASGGTAAGQIGLGPKKPFTTERLGEYNFSSATLCVANWQSCFSCHPFTRPDAINWILNTPNATTKNAKSMLYAWWTPPTSWAGKRPHACCTDGSIRSGISAELFVQPTENLAKPLDTFFMGLRPVLSPHLEKGRLSASAIHGKAVFKQVGCNACHPAPLYCDQSFHNAGVVDPWDANTQWDTPSLIEAWRTNPYGHTGSYDKILDIVKLRAHSLGASSLTAQELDDLVSYVLSL